MISNQNKNLLPIVKIGPSIGKKSVRAAVNHCIIEVVGITFHMILLIPPPKPK